MKRPLFTPLINNIYCFFVIMTQFDPAAACPFSTWHVIKDVITILAVNFFKSPVYYN